MDPPPLPELAPPQILDDDRLEEPGRWAVRLVQHFLESANRRQAPLARQQPWLVARAAPGAVEPPRLEERSERSFMQCPEFDRAAPFVEADRAIGKQPLRESISFGRRAPILTP